MDKMVFVKTLEAALDRNQKTYTKITDQDNVVWNIFGEQKFEVNKSYLFTYETNAKGYPDISKVTPLVNIFVQKALKEVANRNDILRNYSVCFSYAKDLTVAGLVKLDDIFAQADKIFEKFQNKADDEMAKIGEPK